MLKPNAGGPSQEIIETLVDSALIPFEGNMLRYFCFQAFQMNEADIDLTAIDRSKVLALVDTRCLDRGAIHAGFVKVEFRSVKSAKVVDYTHHEFQRIVCLQVETLITLDRIAG